MTIILGIDPGATRAGWAFTRSVDGARRYLDSGVCSLPRETKPNGKAEDFQKYRSRLLTFWVHNFAEIVDCLEDLTVSDQDADILVVFEVVPAIGFQSGGAVQAQLAQLVATVCQALCEEWEIPYTQVAAKTVKQKVTGYGDATKVQVRDGVIRAFPELEPRKRELTATADESDAIAISLVGGGYSVPKAKSNPRRRKKK